MFRTAVAALASLVIGAMPAGGQATSVDEGSFTITRNGERAGRESFSIRSAPGPVARALVAQGLLVLDSLRVAPALNADTAGFPARYQTEVRIDGRVVETYSGQASANRYSARTLRENGESAREFRLPPGTVAAEDEVIHHLWFIARRAPGASVPVLVPRRGVVETVVVEMAGTERLTVDATEIDARHLALRTEGTGIVRDVWVDASGRLLRVAIPALKLLAVRDEAPR